MREDASGMPDEQAEQRVLGGGQLHFTTGASHHARRKINNQLATLEDGNFLCRARFSLRSAQACEQFRRAERFGHVIFCAGIERGDFALLRRRARTEQARALRSIRATVSKLRGHPCRASRGRAE